MCTIYLIIVPKVWEGFHFIELCILIHDFTVQGLCGVTIPFPLNLISSSKSLTDTLHIVQYLHFYNPVFSNYSGCLARISSSRFHVASLVVHPCYLTFMDEPSHPLSCMSRASIIFSSRIPSLIVGVYQLLDAGEYDKVPLHSHGALKYGTSRALRILLAAMLAYSALY